MTQQLQARTIRHKLERLVAATVRSQRLFEPGDHLLVAVSGGPDSVALLSILASLASSWRLTLSALHINYGLRGEESEEDARFVSRFCAQLGVPLVCERVDLHDRAGWRRGRSLQERAREARYQALGRVAADVGADRIALGHTADDQAETLVMWMLRGAGTAGLAGIRPVRGSVFVRPLLTVSRAAILAYLHAKKLTCREDSSNATPLYLRNRIRHELLPALKRFNPAVVEALTRQAAILRDEDQCLEHWASDWVTQSARNGTNGTITVKRSNLLNLPVALQRRVVRRMMKDVTGNPQGPTFRAAAAVLERIVHGRSGSALTVRGAKVEREYQHIRFLPAACAEEQVPHVTPAGRDSTIGLSVTIPSAMVWPPTGQAIRVSLGPLSAGNRAADATTAVFDADRVTPQLVLRSWRPGDVFQPLGMGGRSKKLQDYFCDIKLPRAQRATVPLLIAPEGLLWVVGHRADHRFRVTASTKRVLIAQVLSGDAVTREGQ